MCWPFACVCLTRAVLTARLGPCMLAHAILLPAFGHRALKLPQALRDQLVNSRIAADARAAAAAAAGPGSRGRDGR